MDRKSIIIIVLAVVLLLLWTPLMNKILGPPPARPRLPLTTNQVTGETNATSTASNVTAPAPSTTSAAAKVVVPSQAEKTLIVSNQNVIYHFTSHGGGLQLMELRDYPAAIQCAKKTPAETNLASLNSKAPAPVLGLTGNDALQGDNFYTLSQEGNTVRAEKTLTNGLHITKEFQIGTNYLLGAKIRIENTSSDSVLLAAREVVVGTATSMGPTDNAMNLGVLWYDGRKADDIGESWFANRTLGCIPGVPRYDFEAGAGNVVWTATHNQFFTLAAMPAEPAPKVVIHKVAVAPPDTSSDSAALTNGYQTAISYAGETLKPKQVLEKSFTFYSGPKEYNGLAQIGQKFNNNLDLVMQFGGFFGFFAKFLLLSMNGLHAMGIPYGLTIIAITVVIKLLFWPLTNASTKSMKRMQALQPQMKAIAEKYKDDPAKKNQKTMEFMKEHKVNPMGGCLPMLLQIPVFFGFYSMLRSAIELRGVPFLWACDLSQPDTIFYLAGFQVNPLPLIMGGTMLWQQSLTPPSPGMDPAQQKMMRYMPLMFLLFMYKASSGLALYWTVNNLLTILQTKITRASDDSANAKPVPVAPLKKKK